MTYLSEFGKDIEKEFRKEFEKEYGVQLNSRKLEKTKKKLQTEKNKSHCITFTLMVSWIMFAIVYKFM